MSLDARSTDPEGIFTMGGEMGALMRSYDWSQTPLGSVETWPQSLRSALSICLNSRFPIAIYWGADCLLLYNDAWRPIVGDKHPWALGRPGREVWSEIWDDIGPELAGVLATGEGTFHTDELLSMHRYGYTEECFFEYTFNPIQGEGGVIDGVFNIVTETTYRVLNDRRARLLREVAFRTSTTKTAEEACILTLEALRSDPADIPFARLYLIDPDGKQARLCGSGEFASNSPISPAVIDLTAADSSDRWSIALAARTARTHVVSDLVSHVGALPGSPWTEPPQEAVVLPIAATGQGKVTAVLVAAASPRRRLDDRYHDFFTQLAVQIATAITNARSYEEERRRAEQLVELDRAKTAFFSNVSHEFRTPLTLMLSPLEELLDTLTNRLHPDEREQLQLMQRNGVRLQKLVNTLLDFSRIEAGRVQASYESTDLATYTADLASVFRSLIEQAGMSFIIECPPLPEPVYVDRDMWEKIVLNLISNAFKFTFHGSITVRLQPVGGFIELSIADTGVGISDAELPRLFERFHRVSGTQARTYEGSGIGLALVQELVKLHGGTIRVTSQVDRGTTFTIALPFGSAHLPQERIEAARALVSTASGITPYVTEASRWIADAAIEDSEALSREPSIAVPIRSKQSPTPTARILLADDNADMRDYVKRLLSQYWEVEAVSDGLAALEAISQRPPDLVLSDVMMPRLDGFGLLRELRSNPTTQNIPIILLSARAGEESRIEGLEAGADDYLIKPFSARELLARVEATLKLARLRQEFARCEQTLKIEAKAAQEQVAAILESITDAFVAFDPQWRYTYVNEQAARLLHRTREALLGKNVWEVFPNRVGTLGYRELHRAVAEQVAVVYEEFNPTLGIWLEVHAYPSPKGLAIYFQDISERKRVEDERKQAQQQLQQTLQTLETLIASSPLPIVVIEPECVVQLWNPAAEWLFGWSKAEVLGKPIPIVPDEKREECRLVREAVVKGQIFSGVETYRCKRDGSKVIVNISAAPLYDEQGNVNTIVLIFQDITQRQQAEEALRESEEQFRNMADNAPVMVWTTDPTGYCTYLSQSWYDFTGQTEETGLGLGWVNATHPEDYEYAKQTFLEANERREAFRLEYRLQRKDGQYCWAIDAASPRFGTDGEFKGYIGSVIDISDRKQTELMLVEQKRLLEMIASGQPLDDCLSSLCTSVSKLSPGIRACILLTDAQRQTFPCSITPDFPPSFSKGLKDAPINELAIGTCGTAVYCGEPVTCADIANDDRWSQAWRELCVAHGVLACHSTPILGLDNLPLGSLMLCFDEARMPTDWEYQLSSFGTHLASIVFERDRSSLALRESEAKLRGFVDANVVGILYGDVYGNIHEANDELLRIVGYTREDLVSGRLRWMDITPPEHLPLDEQAIAEAQASGACTPYEKEYIRQDGSRVPVLVGYSLVGEAREESVAFVLDLSDRKQAEEALRQREAELDLVTNAVPALISFVDSDQCYRFNNQGYEEWFGHPTTEIYGRYIREVLGETAYAEIRPYVEQVLAGQQVTFESQLPYKDGGTRYVSATYVPRFNSQGTVEGFVALINDISDRKRAETEREQLLAREQAARAEAERANRVKDEFLAIVSHELRSPLNPILGWSTLLQNRKLDPAKTAQALDTIGRNAKLQAELIEDLLDISRILRGKLSLNVGPIDLASTIQAAMETVRLAAETKSIQIHTMLEPTIGLVSGDSSRLQQVVWNLLSNAIKFTPEGGRVDIRLERLGSQTQITVSDTGKGIHPDFLPYVFDYFRQEDGATTRKFGGLGLGLAIVRHLVELHGGTVQVESPGEGQGATFIVTLPLMSISPQINQNSDSSEAALDLTGIQVLVTDDDADTREFVAFLIEQYGANVVTAASASEALSALTRTKLDVLLSDIGMPGIDGYMLMRQVRALPPEQGGQIPAIALTAYAGEIDYQQAMLAGFQQHLAKPVEPTKLVKAIVNLVQQNRQSLQGCFCITAEKFEM